MVSAESNAKDKDKEHRQKVLEKLQEKIFEKLKKSDLDEIAKELGEESLTIGGNISFENNEFGQINLTYSSSSIVYPPPPSYCPCGTQYMVRIEGETVIRDCPCP